MRIYRWFQASLSEESSRKRYYLVYSLAFAALAFVCFSWFILSGKSLLWFVEDGWMQHYKCLVYYGEYLRQILKNLVLEHRLVIPHWDFCIGEGADIINAMHYYVFGDPFALPSVFVPMRYTHIYFSIACILRLYAAGIAFSALCLGTGRKNKKAVLSGALAYSLCYWGLYTAARHPYFINPMINFPLMILGIEKIIRKERPYLFIASAAVSAASNFYFFYMIVVLAVFYALVRLCILYRNDLKQGILTLLYMGVMAVTGVAAAGLIFLPVLMIFLADSRLGIPQPFHLFYPLSYYSQLPAAFVSAQGGYWLCLGMASPAILSVFLLFRRKKQDLLLKILCAAGFVIVLFPLGGRFLNGMSYMANRWCWVYVLLFCYVLVREWDDLLSLSRKDWVYLMGVSLAIYAAVLLLDKSRNVKALAAMPSFFITMILLRQGFMTGKRAGIRELCLMLVVVLNPVNNAYWRFAPDADNYISEFRSNSRIWSEDWGADETGTIRYFAQQDDPGNEYIRYSGRTNAITHNVNAVKHISSTSYYYSISIPCVNEYRRALQMKEEQDYKYKAYDDRTSLMSLAGVGYYVTHSGDNKGLPYGYELLGTRDARYHVEEKYIQQLKEELGTEELTPEQEKRIRADAKHLDVYKNRYALPMGYCYDAFMTKDTWEGLDPVQKQEALLSAAVTEEEIPGMDSRQEEMRDYHIPFEISCQGDELTLDGTTFTATSGKVKALLTTDEDVKGAEVYLALEGLSYTPVPEYDLYFGDDAADPLQLYNRTNFRMLSGNDRYRIRRQKLFWDPVQDAECKIEASNGVTKFLAYIQPDSAFSSGRNDFIVNLGYMDESDISASITFTGRGIYHFDSIEVYRVPMKGYGKKISRLRENVLENIELGTDCLDGDISLEQRKILCIPTPYSRGWKAYVDGKEQEVLCLNLHYPGLVLESGDHHVHLEYEMPYGKAGLAATLAGFAAWALIAFVTEKKRRSGRTGA